MAPPSSGISFRMGLYSISNVPENWKRFSPKDSRLFRHRNWRCLETMEVAWRILDGGPVDSGTSHGLETEHEQIRT